MYTGRVDVRRRRGGRAVLSGTLVLAVSIVGVVAPDSVVQAAGSQPLATGLNADGQLGNTTTSNRLTPGPVSLSATMVAIASGREHAYALDDTGRIWAWGNNRVGAVGDGIEHGSTHSGAAGAHQRGAGRSWSLPRDRTALRRHGVDVGLRRASGNLGSAPEQPQIPVQVPGSDRHRRRRGRPRHELRRPRQRNDDGVGRTTSTARSATAPRRVARHRSPCPGSPTSSRSAAAATTPSSCGRTDRCGRGGATRAVSSAPVIPPTDDARRGAELGSVAHVDAGAEHSLAVMSNGTVRSWGRGQRGQLGLGTTSNRTTPTVVPGVSGIVEVGDGRDQSFAINAAGDVWPGATTTRANSATAPPPVASRPCGSTRCRHHCRPGWARMTIFLPGEADEPDPDVTPPSVPGRPDCHQHGCRAGRSQLGGVDG